MVQTPDDLSRRGFLERLGWSYAAGGLAGSGALWPALAGALDEENSGPIDCGPPPQAQPHSRTGGESFPPLPLPVTPLRRTERKRPPAPPALIGKIALGPVRWITRDGRRTQYRDWMTDPADVDALLSWTNERLGIHYRAVETEFEHFSFDPRELPCLLFAGHNHFELSDPVRAALARYVLDGGMILGDACCGWSDFTESFRSEMAQIFPDRPLRKMLPEEPVFASYYKLGDFQYKDGEGTVESGAPCLESIDVGCRSAVIFSPVDLTCGWDGHEHPRGRRVVIDQARQIGANLVTYLLGSYQLGRFLSTTRVYFEADAPTRDDFVFAQLIHDGDWDPDPSAVHNLLKFARDNSTLGVKFTRENLHLTDPQAVTCPMLYITGHREFTWSNDETAILQRYLRAGGFLLADSCCGRTAFDLAFRRELAKALPEHRLERLPADHPLLSSHYTIDRIQYTPRVHEDFGPLDAAELEGITLDGSIAVLYSRFDLGNGWEQFPHAYSYGVMEGDALRIGTNAIVYALTH